jgi:hypothetical protein
VLASSPRYDAVKFENGRSTTTEDERDAVRAKLVLLLDKMEEALKPSGWLAGRQGLFHISSSVREADRRGNRTA